LRRPTFPLIVVFAASASGACSRGASDLSRVDAPFSPTISAISLQGSCRTITDNAGTLQLKQDLAGLDSYCLRVFGGSGELDCQGHDVQSLELTDVHGLTVRNCRMRGISVSRSSGVTLANSDITADTRKTVATAVRFADGVDNRIVHNTIDGSWRGQAFPPGGFPPGADDGIIIENDANLLIESNAIRNVWDCGIERLGNRTDSVIIRDNEIADAGECGIGSWFAAGWQDSLIVGNTVANSAAFAEIYFSAAQNRGVDHITLRNNIFESNRFLNPSSRGLPSVNIDFVNGVSRMPVDVANNVFRNNNFGSDIAAPRLAPTTGFVDGGANICRQDGKSTLNCVR
jgi:parallel beta helix pectate lyase-like protein